MEDEEIKKKVREGYANVVQSKISYIDPSQSSCCGTSQASSCGPSQVSCCGATNISVITQISKTIGYSDEEIGDVPEGANLGLGCGNPVALASLTEGETVLDLGSGAGFDCFLSAKRVGNTGKIIGVDMTPEMISQARKNAEAGNYHNVEFRLGEIENLPVETDSVDAVISNCVINLVPNKRSAFQEAFRVLKPGGRLMVSDIVVLKKLPEPIINSIDAYIQCISGAILEDEYIQAIKDAGFEDVRIIEQTGFPIDVVAINPQLMDTVKEMGIPMDKLKELAGQIVSIKVEAKKQPKDTPKSKVPDKLKVDIYVPLEACSCEWSQFMNLMFEAITPYIKHIKHETKSTNSEEAGMLQIHNRCVIVDGEKKYTSSLALKRDLPKILEEKGLL